MLKELFSRLTQSKETRYLQALEASAKSIEESGSPQIAAVLRQFARLKQDIDRRLDARDKAMLPIENLPQLAEAICSGARVKAEDLARIDRELPKVLVARDGQRLAAYHEGWRRGNESMLRAYAALHHAATGEPSPGVDDLLSGEAAKSTLDETVEALRVEIHTAERIRNELGILSAVRSQEGQG